jgi:hypothetical protein
MERHFTKELATMIRPKTIDKPRDDARPSLPFPAHHRDFAGWGPRIG